MKPVQGTARHTRRCSNVLAVSFVAWTGFQLQSAPRLFQSFLHENHHDTRFDFGISVQHASFGTEFVLVDLL